MRAYLERNFWATDEENRRVILETLIPRPGCTALDLGCGDGSFTERIAGRVGAGRVIGLELVPEVAAEARARGIEVVETDLADSLPFEDGSVDVVHSNQVIEHLPRTDHFMREIRRVLSPQGHAVISTNNLASWHNVFSLAFGWQPPPCHVSDEVVVGNLPVRSDCGLRPLMHMRLFTARALSGLAEHHGLRVDLARTAGFYPFPPRIARVLARLDRRHGAYLVQRYTCA